jgi:hypothetical protein
MFPKTKTTFRVPHLFLQISMLACCLVLCHRAVADVTLLDAGSLSRKGVWKTHQNRFEVAQADRLATLHMPSGHWSSLYTEVTLEPRAYDKLRLKLTYELTGDVSRLKHTGFSCRFLKGTSQFLKESDGAVRIPSKVGRGEVELNVTIPKAAKLARVAVNSHGGASLILHDVSVLVPETNLSDAALSGLELPGKTVPAAKAGESAPPAAGVARYFERAPRDFEDAAWQQAVRHRLPVTSHNQRPPVAGDHAAWFQMACDRDALYVRFHADDDRLNFTHDRTYQRDCFEFYFLPASATAKSSVEVRRLQIQISRLADGRTDSSYDACTRLVPGGWEALLKLPWKTSKWDITPFNGLTFRFNASYQDSDEVPQEHWLSFSKKDQTSRSYRDNSVFVPLVIRAEQPLPYVPVRFADATRYHVRPKHEGRLNLTRWLPDTELNGVSFWKVQPGLKQKLLREDGAPYLRFELPKAIPGPNPLRVMLPPFNVLADETLEVTFEARADRPLPAPKTSFLAQYNWKSFRGTAAKPGMLNTAWQQFRITMKVPRHMTGILRNGRVWLDFGKPVGGHLDLRRMRITRRTPFPFDAALRTPHFYSHFWRGEPQRLDVILDSGFSKTTSLKLNVSVRDRFTQKQVFSKDTQLNLPPGQRTLAFPLQLRNGFYDCLLTVTDQKQQVLAERVLSITVGERMPAGRTNPYAALWFHDTLLIPPLDLSKTIAMLRGLGYNHLHCNHMNPVGANGNFLPEWGLQQFKPFKKAGFHLSWTVSQSTPGSHQLWQDMNAFEKYAGTVVKGLRDVVDTWNFANEPDLAGGWFPKPDGREWVQFYRSFYNIVRRQDPTARVLLGSLNRIPTDYLDQAHQLNGHAFSDPLIGVHLYGLNENGNGFEDLLAKRQHVQKRYPGWPVWDNESGQVFKDFRDLVQLQAKKMPLLLTAGIENSYFYNDRDLLAPFGDSNPLLPMEGFKNRFLLDVQPLGRTLIDQHLQVFAFESAKTTKVAFWSNRAAKGSLALPVRQGATVYDIFGNVLTQAKAAGTVAVTLADRWVYYAEGVDLDRLKQAGTFLPAFKMSTDSPARPAANLRTDVHMALIPYSAQFDRELTPDRPHRFSLRLANDSKRSRKISLGANPVPGLTLEVDGGPTRKLAPGERTIVRVVLTASRQIPRTNLVLTGRCGRRNLAPLTLTVKTAPPLAVAGYSRNIVIRNNSDKAADLELCPQLRQYAFDPEILKTSRLSPTETRVLPIRIQRNGNARKPGKKPGFTGRYQIETTWQAGDFTANGRYFCLQPQKAKSLAKPFADLPFKLQPEIAGDEPFHMQFNAVLENGVLRILAKVHDPSPRQTNHAGHLKEGGDALIIAFDTGAAATGPGFGKGDFECGFALSGGNPTSYVWDGTYGLENTKPVPGWVGGIRRDGDDLYYDLRIPQQRLKPDAHGRLGISIVVLNRTRSGETRRIAFGEGIFPSRDARKFGELILK